MRHTVSGDIGASGLAQQEVVRVQSVQTLCQLRREARDEISRLIQFLDASDEYVMTELEEEAGLEEGGDSEPSLGSFDRMTNQEKSWRAMGAADLDAELDTADEEPALGSLDPDHHPNQERWAAGDRRDLEKDDTESGIGDIDGLLEQVGPQDWQAGKGGMI
jgi:hypothetical protein